MPTTEPPLGCEHLDIARGPCGDCRIKDAFMRGIKFGWQEAALCASAGLACGKTPLEIADEIKTYSESDYI